MRSFHSFRLTASVSEHFFFSFLLAFLLFLLSAGFSVPLRGQETSRIVTVGGEVYRGEVIKETADTIMMRSAGGIAVHIPRSSVRAIAYGEEGEVNMKEEGKRVAAGYWSFGGTLGTPAEANLVLARNVNDDWGVRLSGMYYGGSAGVQIEGTRRIGGRGSFRHNLHLGLGTFRTEHSIFSYEGPVARVAEETYIACGYDLNWHGLHGALGLRFSPWDYFSPYKPGLLLQVGYVHQFR